MASFFLLPTSMMGSGTPPRARGPTPRMSEEPMHTRSSQHWACFWVSFVFQCTALGMSLDWLLLCCTSIGKCCRSKFHYTAQHWACAQVGFCLYCTASGIVWVSFFFGCCTALRMFRLRSMYSFEHPFLSQLLHLLYSRLSCHLLLVRQYSSGHVSRGSCSFFF